MKITSVECYLGDYIFCKINTDEGICGFGESGLSYGNCQRAAFGNLQDFGKVIIGMDPFDTEKIWKKLHCDTFWGFNGGVTVTGAMAAIDTACWDIKGKALGVPVYKLLGGKTNDKLRAYAAQLQYGWKIANLTDEAHVCLTDPQEYYDVTKEAMEDGYTAVKIDPVMVPADPGDKSFLKSFGNNVKGSMDLSFLRLAEARIAAAREALGPDGDIIVETHSLMDANTAPILAHTLEKYNIMYFEEPTSPGNSMLFKEIRDKTIIPLATGERSYTRWDYRELYENRLIAVTQPDLCNTGGITETKKICDYAEVYDIAVQIHICGGPIATAAALQVEATLPNFLIHEQHACNNKPRYKKYGVHCWEPENGYYSIPELPGIGEEASEEAMAMCECVVVK